jgi:hypothetical protein
VVRSSSNAIDPPLFVKSSPIRRTFATVVSIRSCCTKDVAMLFIIEIRCSVSRPSFRHLAIVGALPEWKRDNPHAFPCSPRSIPVVAFFFTFPVPKRGPAGCWLANRDDLGGREQMAHGDRCSTGMGGTSAWRGFTRTVRYSRNGNTRRRIARRTYAERSGTE